MSAIGAFTVDRLIGQGQPDSLETEILAEAGVDGFGGRTGALRGRPATWLAWKYYTSSSDAFTGADTAAALRGTYVTVTGEFSETYMNVLVADVRLPPAIPGIGHTNPCMVMVGGTVKYVLGLEFDLMW